MELLFVLDEKDYRDDMPVFEKCAVRGIICKNGKYAMQLGRSGKYKIPGGGVETGESLMEALAREVLEEVGLVVIESSVKEIGEILELREDLKKAGQKYVCHSYYYFCEVEDKELEPQMTASEIREGFHLAWATLDEIIETNIGFSGEKPILRDTKFFMWLKERVKNGGDNE